MGDSTPGASSSAFLPWKAALSWFLFAAGCAAFLYSVVTVIGEAGDPPYTQNDAWQRAAIIACPSLFALTSIWAAVTRRRIVAVLMVAVGTGLCLLAWEIVHWDIPKLFR